MKSLTKLFLGLGGLAAVCGGVAAGAISFRSEQTAVLKATGETQTYENTIRVYIDLTWDNITSVKMANSSVTSYDEAAVSATGTSSIASFVSTNGKYVSDVYQTTSVDGSTAASLRLFFKQGCDYHPTVSSNDWDTTNNYLTNLSAVPGSVVKITNIAYNHQYDNQTQKWFTYSVSTIGQLLHFEAQTGGVLPTGQSATIEVDGTTATLPAACTRSVNDGYAFENWTYGGVKYDAGASITISTANLAAYANYTVTADSFSSWILDDTERNKETCATKFATGKTLYNTMSMAEQAKINPSTYGAAYSRWTAWQAANGETVPQKTSAAVVSKSSDKTATAVIAGLAVISVAAAGGYFFIRKKHVA